MSTYPEKLRRNYTQLCDALGDVLASPVVAQDTLASLTERQLIALTQDITALATYVQLVAARRATALQLAERQRVSNI